MSDGWLLAYRPFLDPLPAGEGLLWTLGFFLPLVVLVSVAYKTIKLDRLEQVPRQSVRLVVQIVVFMVGAAGALSALTWWF